MHKVFFAMRLNDASAPLLHYEEIFSSKERIFPCAVSKCYRHIEAMREKESSSKSTISIQGVVLDHLSIHHLTVYLFFLVYLFELRVGTVPRLHHIMELV